MTYDTEKDFRALMDFVHMIRGTTIGEIVLIERFIDFYLSYIFAKDKQCRENLTDWVFTERIAFAEKLQIFRLTIEKYNTKFKNDNPDYFKDITFLIEQRNIFAHYLLVNGDPEVKDYAKTGIVTFMKYKNDSKRIHYNRDMQDKLATTLIKYSRIFTELMSSIKMWEEMSIAP